MQRPNNLKIGDQFRVIEGDSNFHLGEIITPEGDDGTENPYFWNADKSDYHSMYFSKLEPYTKTIRDAQVGDVVVTNDIEYMVLERWQNTVLLSYDNNSEKTLSNIYHFDELEKIFTLKAEPVVVDDKTAEAIELLKKAGYKITKE